MLQNKKIIWKLVSQKLKLSWLVWRKDRFWPLKQILLPAKSHYNSSKKLLMVFKFHFMEIPYFLFSGE